MTKTMSAKTTKVETLRYPTSREVTIVELFRDRVRALGPRTALRHCVDGAWHEVNWASYGSAVREIAAGLLELGVEPGDRVALLATNRIEWHFADLGILSAGAVTVPVYATSAATQVGYVIGHCGARVAFVEDHDQLAKVIEQRESLPELRHVVLFDDGARPDDPFLSCLDDLRALGRDGLDRAPREVEDRSVHVGLDDLATIVYTSGTTGPPKGAMITHGNITATIDSITQVIAIGPDDRFLSFLPLSHVAERVVSDFGQIVSGGETWFARSFATAAEDLRSCHPTIFFAVPRVWEKFQEAILEEIDATTGSRRRLIERYLSLGRARVAEEQDGRPMGRARSAAYRMLDALLGARIRSRTGLDEARILVSGAAPIHPDLLRWLHGIGLQVAEVYGQTEDCGPTSLNPPERIRIGTAGPPLPGVSVRIADDGEILVKGGNVCRGYYRNEQGTRQLIDTDGWMHSGDVGSFDWAGYLEVTDRKKDLLITAHGKNIAPQEIETRLRYERFVSEAVVLGDQRPYLTALITLDPEALAPWAAERGKPLELEALAWDPDVRAEIAASVQRVNADLSHVETIKKWRILPHDLTIAAGELTPTMKVKRKVVNERYAPVIEEMYAESANEPSAGPIQTSTEER